MFHRLALLFVLLCSFGVTACKGDPPDTPYIPVSNYVAINLSHTTVTLDPGAAIDLHAFGIQLGTIQPVDLTGFLNWSSTNPSVASVNDVGVVFANVPGTAVISAEISGLQSQTCTVIVTGTPPAVVPPPTVAALVIRTSNGVDITGPIVMTLTDTVNLDVIALMSDGTEQVAFGYTFRVSDQRVAEVRFDGVILPIKPGLISINARGDIDGNHLESNYILVQIT